MSENIKTPENENAAAKESGNAKKEQAEKKEFFLKRWGRGIKKWMQEHPMLNTAISAAGGAAVTAGVTKIGYDALNRRKERNDIPQENEYSPLDPNV